MMSQSDGFILFSRKRKNNIYKLKLYDLEKQNKKVKYCMAVNEEERLTCLFVILESI